MRLSGDDLTAVNRDASRVRDLLRQMPELTLVQTDANEPLASEKIVLKEDESSRLGINNLTVETTLAVRYGDGVPVAGLWEGDYNIPVVLKSRKADNAKLPDLEDELIPVPGNLSYVPLRQIADVVPNWHYGQIVRRNGIYTTTVFAELVRCENAMNVTSLVQDKLDSFDCTPGVSISLGGELEYSEETMPQIMSALVIAIVIIFLILLFHFRKVTIALLILCSMSLCLFGFVVGVLLQGVDFGVTCVLGVVSLMGIIVRNGIIMIDYAEELRKTDHMSVRDAAFHSAQRRMRPIFLTSAAASMGVIPMILGKSGLWMPMGTVICYGTLITMVFLLTVLPVSYWLVVKGSEKRRAANELMEKE